MKSKKYEAPKYEHPIYDINWTAGAGRPAGMYWLGGRILMATHDTPAEDALLRVGAVLVATLRYDADPVETVHRSGTLERIDADAAAEAFRHSAAN